MRRSLGLAPGRIRYYYIRAAKAFAVALEEKNAGMCRPDLPTLYSDWERFEETFSDAGYRTYPIECIKEQDERYEKLGLVGTMREHGEEPVLYAKKFAEANSTTKQRHT